VSRSWLYAQDDIREQIRDAASRAPAPPIPASQRASGDLLLRRLPAAHAERNQLLEERARLREENARLRRQIARASATSGTPAIPAASRRSDPQHVALR
jgi:hypothetical protein